VEIKAEKIDMVSIEKIIPNPRNNNRHSVEQLKRLKKIIQFNGFRIPLIISKRSGFLIAGHARLDVAKEIGMKEVPVIYQDFENEAEEYQFLTADNEIARWAELDFQDVYDTIKDFDDFDVDLLGIKKFELLDEELEEDIKDLSNDDISSYAIEVKLKNEMEQQDLYDDLTSKGYDVKIIMI